MTKFAPHGSYEAHIEGRILVARSQDTWNMEMYIESARIAVPLIRKLNQSGTWAYMVAVEGALVYHMNVLAHSCSWVQTLYPSQLAGAAWVISPELEGYSLLMPAYKKAYEGVVPCEVFAEADEAKGWLNSLIATYRA